MGLSNPNLAEKSLTPSTSYKEGNVKMKKWIAVCCITVLASQASAVMLSQGTKELGVNAGLDFQSVDGTVFTGELKLGTFIQYGLEVGGVVQIYESDSASLFGLGAFTEYNFYTETVWVPFLGGSLGLASAEVKGETDETALILGLSGGVKVFLAENVALSGQLGINFASEDIYPDDGDADNVDYALTLGLRFFFP